MQIEINKKVHTVVLGSYALSLYEDAENVELMSGKIPLKFGMVVKLCYYGLVAQGIEVDQKDVFAAFDNDKKLFSKGMELIGDTFKALQDISADAKK